MMIAIDFDGTIAYDDKYPLIGPMLPGAKETINWLYDQGHCILIWTCRCNQEQKDAENYLTFNGVKFNHINSNCTKRISRFMNDSRKIGADIYIDDKSLHAICIGGINWDHIRRVLERLLDGKNICSCRHS